MKRKISIILLIPFLSACLSVSSSESNEENSKIQDQVTETNNDNSSNNNESSNNQEDENDDNGEQTTVDNNQNDDGEENNDQPVDTPENTGEEENNNGGDEPTEPEETTTYTNLGLKTISEARALCLQYVTNLNESNIGVDMTRKVTIRGYAAQKFDLVKTVKKYCLNVSAPAKVLFADSTGYICSASNGGNEGTTLFGKVGSYAGTVDSYYEFSGYLSIYLGKPEIYVPDRSYEWNKDLEVNYDYTNLVKETIDVSKFYEYAVANDYNCAGHGYGDVYKINKLKCVAKSGSVYVFTDGTNYLRGIKGNEAISVGYTYDVIGTLSLQNYSPAIRLLKISQSSEALNVDLAAEALTTKVSDFKKTEASQDDTDRRFDNFINSFKNLRKSTVFASYFTINGKYYVTVGDTYITSSNEITNEATAVNTYNMIELENDNCWNASWSEIERYCPIPNINENKSFDIYYLPWQTHYVNKKVAWKVYALEELLEE